MNRFKLTIEYDGTPYAGWQRQNDMPSVQEAIEKAIFQFAQEEATVQCAGRTDAGVHALAQVAHFDLAKDRTEYEVCEGINFYLQEEPIIILSAEQVDGEFHARFSATGRKYRYRIINRRAPLAIEANRAWQIPWELDSKAMQSAAKLFEGEHDFTSFRDSQCQAKSPIKTLDKLDVQIDGINIDIIAEARSFLHHQVRNMVGTLSLIGAGKWTEDDIVKAFEAKDRKAGGPTAPAQGLYLTAVDYLEP